MAPCICMTHVQNIHFTKQIVQDHYCRGVNRASQCRYKDKGWAYHEGDPSDQRMLAAAAKRGVCLTSRSRPLRPEDMTTFDYILGEPNLVHTCCPSLHESSVHRLQYTDAPLAGTGLAPWWECNLIGLTHNYRLSSCDAGMDFENNATIQVRGPAKSLPCHLASSEKLMASGRIPLCRWLQTTG